MKRLALLALLLASSSVVAAPAPSPKPQRKPEPPKKLPSRNDLIENDHAILVYKQAVLAMFAQRQGRQPKPPAQQPNADPPG